MFDDYIVQQTDDPEPCRLRNLGGSEYGTCDCHCPKDCPNPPLFTPMSMMMARWKEFKEAKDADIIARRSGDTAT